MCQSQSLHSFGSRRLCDKRRIKTRFARQAQKEGLLHSYTGRKAIADMGGPMKGLEGVQESGALICGVNLL